MRSDAVAMSSEVRRWWPSPSPLRVLTTSMLRRPLRCRGCGASDYPRNPRSIFSPCRHAYALTIQRAAENGQRLAESLLDNCHKKLKLQVYCQKASAWTKLSTSQDYIPPSQPLVILMAVHMCIFVHKFLVIFFFFVIDILRWNPGRPRENLEASSWTR